MADHEHTHLHWNWLLTLPLFGVVGCSAFPGNAVSELIVDSTPSGAEVSVMGEARGVTPLRLPTSTLFPVTYPPEKQSLYGRVRITHPGCTPYETPISNSALENGLHIRLQCEAVHAPLSPAVVPASPRERLKQLEALKQEGLLDEQEYRQARQRIIDSL